MVASIMVNTDADDHYEAPMTPDLFARMLTGAADVSGRLTRSLRSVGRGAVRAFGSPTRVDECLPPPGYLHDAQCRERPRVAPRELHGVEDLER